MFYHFFFWKGGGSLWIGLLPREREGVASRDLAFCHRTASAAAICNVLSLHVSIQRHALRHQRALFQGVLFESGGMAQRLARPTANLGKLAIRISLFFFLPSCIL